MSDRVIRGGAYRALATGHLRTLIHRLARSPLRPSRTESPQVVAERLLAHPYLVHDPWHDAEARHTADRLKRCRRSLEGLRVRLERGEIEQHGVSGATGQATLTADKLTDHGVRLLDISANWLLAGVDRHPEGGSGVVRTQFWLYGRAERDLHLLLAQTRARITQGHWAVSGPDNQWRAPSEDDERDFYQAVLAELGAGAVERIRAATRPQEALCPTSKELLEAIAEVSGVDYAAEEQLRRHARERMYRARYGPHAGPPAISTAAVVLVYADE